MKTYLIYARWSRYRSGFGETYIVNAETEKEAGDKVQSSIGGATYVTITEIDLNEPYYLGED